jgi:hypothetical protein
MQRKQTLYKLRELFYTTKISRCTERLREQTSPYEGLMFVYSKHPTHLLRRLDAIVQKSWFLW